jgi:hypothetical protein
MARTAFEELQGFLKAHPNARPVAYRRRRSIPQPDSEGMVPHLPDPERHSRKCRICKHPNREDIELEFLRWRSSIDIARSWGIYDHSSICRHARALGLYDRRDQTIAFALEPILENSEQIFMRATANAVINAVRTYSQINAEGKRRRSPCVNNIFYVTFDENGHLVPSSRPPVIRTPFVPPVTAEVNRQIQKLVAGLTR